MIVFDAYFRIILRRNCIIYYYFKVVSYVLVENIILYGHRNFFLRVQRRLNNAHIICVKT